MCHCHYNYPEPVSLAIQLISIYFAKAGDVTHLVMQELFKFFLQLRHKNRPKILKGETKHIRSVVYFVFLDCLDHQVHHSSQNYNRCQLNLEF